MRSLAIGWGAEQIQPSIPTGETEGKRLPRTEAAAHPKALAEPRSPL